MSATNRELTEKIDKNIKYMSVARLVGIVATVITVVLVVGAMFFMLVKLYDLNQTIEGCINPQGKCYQSGDRRSGAAVKTINETQKRIVTVAAYCAKQPGNNTLEQIEACTNKELSR